MTLATVIGVFRGRGMRAASRSNRYLIGGGGTWSGGYLFWGGGGTWSRGVCVPGLGGVPGPGGWCTWSGGCTWSRGMFARYTPQDQTRYIPRDQTRYPPWTRPGTPLCVDRHTPVNLLPWPNFVAAGKNLAK